MSYRHEMQGLVQLCRPMSVAVVYLADHRSRDRTIQLPEGVASCDREDNQHRLIPEQLN